MARGNLFLMVQLNVLRFAFRIRKLFIYDGRFGAFLMKCLALK